MRVSLKIAIVQTGKSQRHIARACGMTENRLSKIVQGWIEPSEAERESLAATVGRPASDLFKELATAS